MYRQVVKTQRQIVGTKMGSTTGNDQNTLFVWFYAKIWSKNAGKYAMVLEIF